jgi:uncharacterized membrane protein
MLFGAVLFCAFSSFAQAESISSFNTNIDIHKDSSFSVTEKITYNFGSAERHGIFRYIPTDHPQDASAWYLERYADIGVTDVLRDGSSTPYTVSKESGQVYLKIGDPNKTITGVHVYTISYDVRGGLSYFKYGGAELYWNVTGTDWDVPIQGVTVTLMAPTGVFTTDRACYRGIAKGTATCNSTNEIDGGVEFTARALLPGKGMTIAQGIDRTKVDEVVLERGRNIILLPIALALWLLLLTFFVYRYRTTYRTNRTIIAQYEPYDSLGPMYAGLLFDGVLNPRDITSCIVYLAEKGYLKIRKTDKKVLFFFETDDYEIACTSSVDSIDSAFQKKVLELLYDGLPKVGDTVTLSGLKSNMKKRKENSRILQTLKKDLEADLVSSGYFQETISKQQLGVGVFLFIALVIIFAEKVIQNFSINEIFAVLFIALSLVALAFAYRRRTKKGYEALDHLKGFKQFLSVTEKERYEFHDAPEKSPEQFMKFLPYAIAFGVEKEWAKVFKDVTLPDPDWYDAGTSGAAFSAVNLSTSVGAFSDAFVSSTGSSASSGGGSVGGGGGGGGGGSW